MKRLVVCVIVLLATIACADEDEFYELAADLKYLTEVVDGYVRYGGADIKLQGDELIKVATSDTPRLVEPFQGYVLKALQQDGSAYLLVCTSDDEAILGDAGCTTAMEDHYWQTTEHEPCEFSPELIRACSR